MNTPSIPLNADQTAFLSNLNYEVGPLFNIYDDFKEIAKRIEARGGCREIYRNENGKPVLYLKRYYLYRGLEREAMIHQFFLGDKGPLHDHPADSWGSILSVGYNERLCTSIAPSGRTEGEYEVSRNPGDWSYRPASTVNHDNFEGFHKVKLRNPSDGGKIFTFFVMEKRNENSWGFRDNDGHFVPFDQMNKNEKVDSVQSSPDQYGYGWFPRRVK
jgi:hypothetical protein